MDLTIRPACEADAPAIVALLNPIIEAGTFTAMESPFSVQDQRGFIRDFPELGVYHVAIDNGCDQILGIQDVLPNLDEDGEFTGFGEISTFVALGVHRRGIGSRLCEATFDAAKNKRYTKLHATIRADNPQAFLFYVQQQFRVLNAEDLSNTVPRTIDDRIVAERVLT